MDKVRFRKPVVPGDQLILKVRLLKQRTRMVKMSGQALVDDQLVAEAEMMAATVRTPWPPTPARAMSHLTDAMASEPSLSSSCVPSPGTP